MDTCLPNITPTGQHRRRVLGIGAALITLLMLAAAWAGRPPMAVRALVFVPACISALGFLQARRQTCVVRAMEGRREQDQGGAVAAEPAAARASQRVAAGIVRDVILVGLLATAAAVLPALT